MKCKQLLSYTLLVLFTIGLSACSDSGTSSGGSDKQAPSIPDLSVVAKPDFSYFQNNNPKGTTTQASDGFSNAKNVVLLGSGFLTIGQVYSGFLSSASQNNAKFNDGQFVWEYNYAASGQSVSVRTTATPQSNGYMWSVFYSFDDGQGNSINDYKIMSGTTSDDGKMGSWTFYVLDSSSNERKAFTSTWSVTSDTKETITSQTFDEEGAVSSETTYTLDGAKNTFTLDYSASQPGNAPTVVFWNTSSMAGYYINDPNQICWNSSFQNTSCSSLGF